MCISIGYEGLLAAGAGKGVKGFPVDGLRMCIPPFLPAGRRAEFDRLSAWNLSERLTAVFAAVYDRLYRGARIAYGSGQVVPAAEGGDLILRKAYGLRYGSVPVALAAQCMDLVFLLISHNASPPVSTGDGGGI